MDTFEPSSQLRSCIAALIVLERVLSIKIESKLQVKVICGKKNRALGSKESY